MRTNITTFLAILLTVLLCNLSKAFTRHDSSSDPEMQRLLKKLVAVLEKEHIPGLMISIVKKDSILFSGGLGYADLEQKIMVNANTQFHLASVTKFFVAMGIQILISEGRLDLNDRLHDIAPEIPFTNPWESTNPVRIVHLLEHTAGFEDIHVSKMVNTERIPQKGIDAIQSVKSSFTSRWKPGERTSYSNPGYNILGYIIEKISKRPWNEFLKLRLLDPLGMQHTTFDLSGNSHISFAKGYDFSAGKFKPLPLYGPSSNGASSALVSDASDMSRFLHYLLTADENSNILKSKDLDEMERVHSTLASKRGLQTGYALGNDLFPNNKKIPLRGHNGKGEGIVSWIFFNRQKGVAYAISANANVNLYPVSQLIEEYLTQDVSAPILSSVELDGHEIEPMLGYYQFLNPKNERWEFHKRIFGGIRLLSVAGDKLIVDRGYGQIDSLIHMGNKIFRVKGDIIPSVVVGTDDDGRPFFHGYGNGFYRKAPYGPVLLQKTLIYLGLIAALLSMIYTVVGIPMALLRKISLIDLCLVLLPSLGMIAFFVSFRLLGKTEAVSKELLTYMNMTSFSIFAGMLFLGISVAVAACLLYRRWMKIGKKWIKIALAFNTIFLFYLVVLFAVHGWIGIPVWLM